MVRRVAVQITKIALVFSVVVFVVVPLGKATHFLVLLSSVLLFLICIFLLRKLVGENTGDRFTTFLLKKLSRKKSGDQASGVVNPRSEIQNGPHPPSKSRTSSNSR
jgi:hypothetical protein